MQKTASCYRWPLYARALKNRNIAKTWMIMRLTAILLTVVLLDVSAKSRSQQVSFSGKKVPIETVFREVKKQTGYSFFYDASLLKSASQVTIDAKEIALMDFLRIVFENQPLSFSVEKKDIIVSRKRAAEPVTFTTFLPITGRITDASGNALTGATVRVKGKSISSVTDEQGTFSLTASEGDVLIISYIGFSTREIKITGASSLSILLVQQEIKMDTATVILNTGYQTLSKERSAGSFAKPDMDIIHDRSTSMNVLQRLDGLVPGLVVGNSPSDMLLRGLTTIGLPDGNGGLTNTGRTPLYIVDGIPLDDVSSINPQDVADITVLKDATAASIWGARASNGVIVIATKKGTLSQKLKVNYNSFINFQGKPDLDYFPVMNSRDYITTVKEMFNAPGRPDPLLTWESISGYINEASTGVAPHDVILYNQYRGLITAAQADKSLDSLASINNVQQIKDLFYQNAAVMNHTISLSGGSGVYAIYGSFAYTNTKLQRPEDKNNSYKLNVRQDFTLSKHIQLYLISDFTNTISSAKRYTDVNNKFYPYQLFKDKNGNNLPVNYAGYLSDSLRMDYQERSRINFDYVPLDEVNYGYTKSDGWLSRITAGTTIKLFKGLRFEGVYGYVKGNNKTTSYDDAKSYMMRMELAHFTVAPDPSSTPEYYLPKLGGKLQLTNANQQNWTVRNQLVYDNSWNNRLHQLTMLAGQEAQERLITTNTSTVRGYDEELQSHASIDYATLRTVGISNTVVPSLYGSNTLGDDAFANSELRTRFTSYYANAAYTFDRKYTVNGSWRIDKSNLFGLDKSAQYRAVWSVGGKWMLSEEKFMRSNTWLERLAVRTTYGITGNSPAPGTTASYDIFTGSSSNPNMPNGLGLSFATAGNRKLTWEMTKTINLGVDFSVLHSRINGSIDVYQKKTENLLGSMPVNGFTGQTKIVGNFGSLRNKGVELGLRSLNISGRNFSWNSQLTLSYNKNKVIQLNDPTAISTGYQKVFTSYVTGFPAFAVFAYPFAGLDNMGDPMIRLADKTVTKQRDVAMPGDIPLKGTAQPVWSGGLSNMFRYKGFGLAANMIYNLGHVMRRITDPYPKQSILHDNVLNGMGLNSGQINAEFLHRWKKPGDEAFTNIPSYEPNFASSDSRRDLLYYYYGDIHVVSASYIKLRDITFTYSLPKRLLDQIKTGNITLRVQVSNIMLWKANRDGIDPEFGGNYPFAQHSLTVGANVIF